MVLLDYISSSVHVKSPLPTAPQEDAWPGGRIERLPPNIHMTVMTTHIASSFRVTQKAARTTLSGGNCYIHQMSHIYAGYILTMAVGNKTMVILWLIRNNLHERKIVTIIDMGLHSIEWPGQARIHLALYYTSNKPADQVKNNMGRIIS